MSQVLIDTMTAVLGYVYGINYYSFALLDSSRADLTNAIEMYRAAIQNASKVVTIIQKLDQKRITSAIYSKHNSTYDNFNNSP